jgi:hypothetical protein
MHHKRNREPAMSTPFYDLASLVVVPSGYKSGKIYAQKPLTTDGQLTFTRASTATRVNASGALETVSSGVPRLDYTDSSCPKLLLEPQRTNYMTYSNDFTSGAWSKITDGTYTIETETVAGPWGASTSIQKITLTSGNYLVLRNVATGISFPSTASVYYKKTNANTGLSFDFSDIQNVNAQNNTSWQRFSYANNSSSYPVGAFLDINVTTVNQPVYLAYAQLEEGLYPTSVINTTSAAVTRLADAAQTASVPSLIGQTAGTIFWQGKIDYLTSGDGHAFSLSSSDSNFATAMLLYRQSGNGHIAFYMQIAGANQFGTPLTYNDTASISENDKYAIAYANNDLVIYKNGVQIISANSGSIPAFNYFLLNEWVNTYNNTNITKQALLFKTRLTNAQLAELTTL